MSHTSLWGRQEWTSFFLSLWCLTEWSWRVCLTCPLGPRKAFIPLILQDLPQSGCRGQGRGRQEGLWRFPLAFLYASGSHLAQLLGIELMSTEWTLTVFQVEWLRFEVWFQTELCSNPNSTSNSFKPHFSHLWSGFNFYLVDFLKGLNDFVYVKPLA